MATQDQEMSIGWPLGLEIMNSRFQEMENSQTARTVEVEPNSIHLPSFSFSSLTSSNLDTETSSVSFFQDNSVSLGRLIGFKASDKSRLYFPKAMRFEEHHHGKLSVRETKTTTMLTTTTNSCVRKGQGLLDGICIPLTLKKNKSRIQARQ